MSSFNIGLFLVLSIFFSKLKNCFYLFYSYWAKPINFKNYGNTAIITGASDGIGKEYAKALAKRGLDVIIIARTKSKLEVLCADIEKYQKVRANFLVFDFDQGDYSTLKPSLERILHSNNKSFADVAVLVNNVGLLDPNLNSFVINYKEFNLSKKLTDAKYQPDASKNIKRTLNTNCLSMTSMCSIILPEFLKKRKGIIINLSSVAAASEYRPLITVYAATKSFNNFVSQSIAAECAAHCPGILVQTVKPGIVYTDMAKTFVPPTALTPPSKLNMMPTADVFVKYAIRTVGYRQETCGYYMHSLLYIYTRVMHRFLSLKNIGKLDIKFMRDLL